MPQPRVHLDLTPWHRNPHSGIGQTARRSFDALSRLPGFPFHLAAVSRYGRHRRPPLIRWQPTLYHSFEHKLPTAFGVARVMTVHDLWTLSPNGYQPPQYQKRHGPLLLQAIGAAQALVTPSEAVRLELLEHFPYLEKRVYAVPHGCQVSADGPLSPLRGSIETFLHSGHPFVLTIACLEHRKNLLLLLKAIERLDIRLALVGKGGFGASPIMRALTTHTRPHAISHWSELTDIEIRALMHRCALYVQPSLDEGFGMPVIDAIAFGKKVVLSDLPVFREIAGGFASFFPKTDCDALCAAIQTGLALPSPEDSQRKQFAQKHTWEKAARHLATVYQATLAQYRSPLKFF